MRPLLLPANQPLDRFYAGGATIARFRGDPEPPRNTPEDWIASATSVRGEAPSGLTMLPDGRTLAAAVRDDPDAWLGPEHVAAFGSDVRLLVKLLDAGQRLPVHLHPSDEYALTHLGAAHGKAEAWYILQPGEVFIGLCDDVDVDHLTRLVRDQATTELLSLLCRVEVAAGDTVYVPPGVLHAIGEGVFLLEVQQPEDQSILLEWSGFAIDGERDGHLGLGFDVAMGAAELTSRDGTALDELIGRGPRRGPVLPESARRFFRLDRTEGAAARFEAGFAVVVVVHGTATLTPDGPGESVDYRAGSTVVVPFGFGGYTVTGGETLIARPPAARTEHVGHTL